MYKCLYKFFVPYILTLSFVLFFSTAAYADCFILKELGASDPVIKEGECEERVSPCSTFKIPIALMGFESGVLKNTQNPILPFKPEYAQEFCSDKWKAPHNPISWIKNSCVWYSQIITQTLGEEKFKEYVQLFNYGNQDISGDSGKNNGLTQSWLSSSLKISPVEQIEFIAKILNDQIPVSTNAVELTKQILWVGKIHKDWVLYGKTGSGNQLKVDGTRDNDRQIGWFVGWINHPSSEKRYIFTYLIQDQGPEKAWASVRAKEKAETKIKAFIKTLTI